MRISTPSFCLHPQPCPLPSQDLPSSPIILNDGQDFDLPPALRLSPQQLEFIDLDEETNDTFGKQQHQPPETPKGWDNPFFTKARRHKIPIPTIAPATTEPQKTEKIRTKEQVKIFPHLEDYRRKIAPLLDEHQRHKQSKGAHYPQEVKHLFHQAAKENPGMPNKHLAAALGIPSAITYYWRGYRNPKRSAVTKKPPSA